MKVFKPAWINHNGMPICSIDIHPDGTRVATGGQGEDSGRVVIWNMAPVLYEEKETNENVPRILCQLDNHLACVNCVRWNTTGKYLASGGDDKLVMLWSISKGGGGGGLGLKSNVESWRCVATLRGHHGDVLDMAWSPHDIWLATCSVDNTVIIWRMDSNPPVLVTVLRGHTGLVKGVAWDPVGKYLSSQSDDKTVRVWRTSDWAQEAAIKQPFLLCSGTTLVLRLSWSPDGQYLVTAHAMNGKVPTAQIIDRDGWTYDKDFVGHHMAITCVRFSGFIMETERNGKVSRSCCCVLGSRDRSLSIWITCLNRPVVVLQNLFNSPVYDVSWGPRGLALMACSGDGTVAYLQFTSKELGTPISQADKDQLFEKLYGKSSICEPDSNLAVLENPEVLSLRVEPVKAPVEQKPTKAKSSPVTPVNQNSMNSCSSKQPTPPMTKQIETRRADGKRRITPIFIPPPSSDTTGDEVGLLSSDTNTTPFSSSVQTKSKIVIERLDFIKEEGSQSQVATPLSVQPQTTTPLVQPPPGQPSVCQPPPQPPPSESGFNNLMSMERKRKVEVKVEPSKVSRGGGAVAPVRRQLVLPPLESASSHTNTRLQLVDSPDWVLFENGLNLKWPSGPAAIIKRFSLTQPAPVWSHPLGSEVVGSVACMGAVAVGCKDSTLHLVSTESGDPLLPPLVLPGPVSYLSSPDSGLALVCITADGTLYSWRLTPSGSLETILSAVSMAPLVHSQEGEVRVKECMVSDDCEPLVALSNGKAFMYSIQHKTWFLLGNSSDPISRCSLNTLKSGPRQVGNAVLPLKNLQAAANTSVSKKSVGLGVGTEVGALCTVSFLQTQLARALLLKSHVEYRFWLLTFVRFLLDHGMEKKLRSICGDLLGPCHSSAGQGEWSSSVLGMSKHGILSEVLTEMGSNLKMQRLYLEVKEQFELVSSSER